MCSDEVAEDLDLHLGHVWSIVKPFHLLRDTITAFKKKSYWWIRNTPHPNKSFWSGNTQKPVKPWILTHKKFKLSKQIRLPGLKQPLHEWLNVLFLPPWRVELSGASSDLKIRSGAHPNLYVKTILCFLLLSTYPKQSLSRFCKDFLSLVTYISEFENVILHINVIHCIWP